MRGTDQIAFGLKSECGLECAAGPFFLRATHCVWHLGRIPVGTGKAGSGAPAKDIKTVTAFYMRNAVTVLMHFWVMNVGRQTIIVV